eukprot:COSAG02_NODE_24176_length_695_cov_2.955919_1_plen_169_part_01
MSLEVGSNVDAKDRGGWYAASIVAATENKVKAHYIGFGRRYDRWMDRDMQFVRRRSKHDSIAKDSWGRPVFVAASSGSKRSGSKRSHESTSLREDPVVCTTATSRRVWGRHSIATTEMVEKEVAPDKWTIKEDVELAELIDQYGTGGWESKARSFSTTRSAGALGNRYH